MFVPIKHADLKGLTTKPLMAFARVKRKVNPDGTPGNLKTRIVADGRQEDRSIYAPDPLDTYAPTISMTLLLLMLGIFAKNDMHVST